MKYLLLLFLLSCNEKENSNYKTYTINGFCYNNASESYNKIFIEAGKVCDYNKFEVINTKGYNCLINEQIGTRHEAIVNCYSIFNY